MTVTLNAEAIEFLKMISEVLIDESIKLDAIQNGTTSLSQAVLNTNNTAKKTNEKVVHQTEVIQDLHEHINRFTLDIESVKTLLTAVQENINGNDDTIQFLAEALNKLTDSRQEELQILVDDHEVKVENNLHTLAEILNQIHSKIELLDRTDDLQTVTAKINELTARIDSLDASQAAYDDGFNTRVDILAQNTSTLIENLGSVQEKMTSTIDTVQQIGAKMLVIEARVNSLSDTNAREDLEHLVESEL